MSLVDQLLSMIRTNELSTVSVRRVFANASGADIDDFFLDVDEKMTEEEAESVARALFPFKNEVEQYAQPYLAGIAAAESAGGNATGSNPETDHSESTGTSPGDDSAPGDAGDPAESAGNNPNGEQNHE